ncbi:hypothetical protein SAMN04487905_10649 [Actinopolyspora xinjiangensis]|uniref:Uncharacterized protein n=1 Tax=Actinopolyspora xinjiangensis TaxID=405564 RepID=A0A1H0U4P9_9ACTN|nr:hypothetical protein [Actinopolyspora xinjiangensis]SDP61173.1 hypothetical protein SAMN04487905_10649 [Actinopolyspora xinjiangensis]
MSTQDADGGTVEINPELVELRDYLARVEKIADDALAARDRWVERAHRAEARLAEQRRARMSGQSRDIQQMCDETEAIIADQIDQNRSDLRERCPEQVAPLDALRRMAARCDEADDEGALIEPDEIRLIIRDALADDQ